MSFRIYPAIDLKDGRAVRLRQGDPSRETRYAEDPAGAARRFAEAGARALHVVDLDGALVGAPVHLAEVARIRRETGLPIRLGGGLRRAQDLDAAFQAGADVAIVGTAAAESPELLREWVRRFGARVAVSIDVRDRIVRTRGWSEAASASLDEIARRIADAGVEDLVVTDVARDGELTGPDLALFRRAAEVFGRGIVAAGGIAKAEDLERLASEPGVRGAVVGRAFYEGTIPLTVLAVQAGERL